LFGKAHVAEAFRWSTQSEVELAAILAAGFGMAGPALLGAAVGQFSLGLAASIGAMAVDGAGMGRKAQLTALAEAFVPAAFAVIAATFIAGHGWLSDAIIVMLAGAAAIIGGFNRLLAMAGIRFVVFLIIAAHATKGGDRGLGLLVPIALGALWTSILGLTLSALVRAHRHLAADTDSAPPIGASTTRDFARWKLSLASLSGWNYPLRLTLCLAVAAVLQSLWPEHHLYWIALTIALLCQRQIEAFPVRTTQRAIGTAFGIAAASLLLSFKPPALGLALGIGVLAGLRPLLKARNYLAYSAVMTPLVMLIVDAGAPLEAGILIDRFVATLIGAALTIFANLIFVKILTRPT